MFEHMSTIETKNCFKFQLKDSYKAILFLMLLALISCKTTSPKYLKPTVGIAYTEVLESETTGQKANCSLALDKALKNYRAYSKEHGGVIGSDHFLHYTVCHPVYGNPSHWVIGLTMSDKPPPKGTNKLVLDGSHFSYFTYLDKDLNITKWGW